MSIFGLKSTFMQLEVKLYKRILISVAIMAIMIAFISLLPIPNPNMILITGLVLCSALFGFGGGAVASVIMFAYSLYFFSTDHSFFDFTVENSQKICVILFSIIVNMLLVSSIKLAEIRAFREVRKLTDMLHQENLQLQSLSFSDALTGVLNRMALRRDYDTYNNREVTVIMIDLDDFKTINDTLGHKEGDRVLRETGALLVETFGREHCYRYGGDEFIIIMAEVPESRCHEMVEEMLKKRPSIALDRSDGFVGYSVGYSHETISGGRKLRDLFADADQNMYSHKRSKK